MKKKKPSAKKDIALPEVHAAAPGEKQELPFFISPVSAGFPSPAEDYQDRKLDLNELLISHPSSTFFVRVNGDSMKDAGIFDGDLLVVDRSIPAADTKIIIAVVNGEFTVKRMRKKGERIFLVPENSAYKELEIVAGMDFTAWGVVTYCIHKV